MSDDRLKMPPVRDFGFYQRRKHDKWREVEPPWPALEAVVADSHAHVHMLPDPAWELVRCAACGVRLVCEIVDPSEDDVEPGKTVDRWRADALDAAGRDEVAGLLEGSALSAADLRDRVPEVRVAAGVHPHNARLYDDRVEHQLREHLEHALVVGEIGLDYHYDLSPRDVQREVFRRQVGLARELGMPIALHLRGGDDPSADDAHGEAFGILQEEGFPGERTLLHCCTLSPEEIAPWIEAGCFIAYGGALTFKAADAAREAATLVPEDRLLLETDSPYMTPEPMRGAACTPAHVVFTAARLAEVRGIAPGAERERFLNQLNANARRFFARADGE